MDDDISSQGLTQVLDLYVWLSFRFEDAFPDHELASSQKAICSLLIEELLEGFGWLKPKLRSLQRSNRLASLFPKRAAEVLVQFIALLQALC
ncbi:Mitochondrial degradasome RNA helicase subunit, C-terminal domain [Dillenia turbinata]|uniref:Mitochondrial degradasome RNA helicase subunit, C-terminal domain n=1 Tax=Dillenia turbinata TaxID=194707 RepID=A0AAN8VDZ7_9MAGN